MQRRDLHFYSSHCLPSPCAFFSSFSFAGFNYWLLPNFRGFVFKKTEANRLLNWIYWRMFAMQTHAREKKKSTPYTHASFHVSRVCWKQIMMPKRWNYSNILWAMIFFLSHLYQSVDWALIFNFSYDFSSILLV